MPSFAVPPAAQGGDRERGGIPVAVHRHPAGVRVQVVDPVRDRVMCALLGKIVRAYLLRLPRPVPLTPGDRVVAQDLLLLGIDADDRLSGGGELPDPVVDVMELRVAVGMRAPSVVREVPCKENPSAFSRVATVSWPTRCP
jgi:hypothetical protein